MNETYDIGYDESNGTEKVTDYMTVQEIYNSWLMYIKLCEEINDGKPVMTWEEFLKWTLEQ
jgi:hypothetical protein